MKQIKNAEARLHAESCVWKNHSVALERQYNNKMKINGDTKLESLFKRSYSLVPEIAITKHRGGDISNLLQEQIKVESEIEKSLVKYDLKKADLELSPTCEICGDTGKVATGDCECFKRYMFEYISSRLSSAGKVSFESSKEFAKDYPGLYKFYDYASQFCEIYPNVTKQILFLRGEVGCGKTHLANAILGQLISKGASGLFISAFTMEDTFVKHMYNATSFNPNQTVNDEYSLINTVDVLVVDDLGAEIIHMEKIKAYYINLLENRVASGKLTIFTTNLKEDDVKQRYGERFLSRITNKNTVVMKVETAVDLRQKKQ